MSDSPKVIFNRKEEFDSIPIPRPEPKGIARRLMRAGIVNAPGDAAIVLAILAVILIAANIYVFTKAFPEAPTLGPDVLRAGETVPANSPPR